MKDRHPRYITVMNEDFYIFCVIVIGELLSGFRSGKYEKRNRQELNEFMASPRVKILSIDPHAI